MPGWLSADCWGPRAPELLEKGYHAARFYKDLPTRFAIIPRYGQPEDIASLVCYLASPLARYITGTVIPVDGGMRRYQF